jgi:hypothetical protein
VLFRSKGQSVPVSRAMDLRMKDPIEFEMRLNYFIEKGFFDKDSDFKSIMRKATTSAARKLVDKINEENPRQNGSPGVSSKDDTIKEGEVILPNIRF